MASDRARPRCAVSVLVAVAMAVALRSGAGQQVVEPDRGSPLTALAEDIAQEAFVALLQRFDTLDEPAAYLRTTLVNLTRNHHHRDARRLRGS